MEKIIIKLLYKKMKYSWILVSGVFYCVIILKDINYYTKLSEFLKKELFERNFFDILFLNQKIEDKNLLND